MAYGEKGHELYTTEHGPGVCLPGTDVWIIQSFKLVSLRLELPFSNSWKPTSLLKGIPSTD